MGWTAGLIGEKIKEKRTLAYVLGIIIALIIKIVGYYFTEVILYQNWIVPLGSIPGNVMQVLVAGIIVLPFAERIKKIAAKY